MKQIAKTLTLFTLMLMPLLAHAQLNIQGTKYSFDLDANEWRYLRTFKMDDGGTTYLYAYVGEVLLDEAGDTVLPYLRIYVREKYDDDIYQFVYERYEEKPYQSLKEYSQGPGLPKSGGLGYEGMYTQTTEQRDYHFYMTYFKERRTMVEFRLETTRDTFDEMEVKFKKILESVH